MKDKQYITAIYEASHFVLNLLYHRDKVSLNEKDRISIVKSRGRSGCVEHEVYESNDAKHLKYCLAGFAGEFIIGQSADSFMFLTEQMDKEKKSKYYDQSDTKKIYDLLSIREIDISDGMHESLLHDYFIEAIEDLKNNWTIVEYVASELMAHETLEGEKHGELWNMTVSLLDLKKDLE